MTFFSRFSKYVSSAVLSMIGFSCYILADTYFISAGVGGLGLAALNFAIPIFSMISGVGLMSGVGAASLFSAMRAKRDSRADALFTNACLFGLAVSLVISLLGIAFSTPISRLLGADTDTLTYTNEYLKTLMCMAPLFIMNNILTAFVRNDGNPRLSMAAMLIGSFSNILLDYVFIFPMKLGMFGAAAATAAAPLISICVLSLHFIKKMNTFSFRRCRISLRLIGMFLGMGVFSLVTEVSSGVVMTVFNRVILAMAGNTGVAAYGVIANIALVAISVFTGISQGIQPLVSVAAAGENRTELRRTLCYAAVLSLAISGILMAAAILFRVPIVSVFNSEKDAALTEIAEHGLPLYFLGFFPAGLNIIAASFLSACEKAKEGFLVSLLRGIVLILPAVLILPRFLDMDGVWLSFGTAEILTLGVSLLCILSFLRQFAKINGKNT